MEKFIFIHFLSNPSGPIYLQPVAVLKIVFYIVNWSNGLRIISQISKDSFKLLIQTFKLSSLLWNTIALNVPYLRERENAGSDLIVPVLTHSVVMCSPIWEVRDRTLRACSGSDELHTLLWALSLSLSFISFFFIPCKFGGRLFLQITGVGELQWDSLSGAARNSVPGEGTLYGVGLAAISIYLSSFICLPI